MGRFRGDFEIPEARGGDELGPRRSQEVRGSSRPSFGGRVVRLLGPLRAEQAESPKQYGDFWVIGG